MEEDPVPGHWPDDMEDPQWLELLQPFTTVKDLHLSAGLAIRVARALQELAGARATEVLPALQRIFIEGSQLSWALHEAILPFIAARQLSGHPVAIHHWKR